MQTGARVLLGLSAACLVSCMLGCGSHSCGGSLSSPLTGPGGVTVALTGISNGASIPCSGLSSGETCDFTAGFSVSQLGQPASAELAVEICTDADGSSFSSENPGQSPVFIQPGRAPLMPGDMGGSLAGVLGPPVSNRVRFALQVDLVDSNGQKVAVSQPIVNLAPE